MGHPSTNDKKVLKTLRMFEKGLNVVSVSAHVPHIFINSEEGLRKRFLPE